MQRLIVLLLAGAPAFSTLAHATPLPCSAQEDPEHQALRALRDGVLGAIKSHDLGKMLTFVHPNVVVTWQNAEVSRGHEGFTEYYRRMMDGPASIVERVDMDTKVDELSILYGGDTAIAFGSSADHFELRSGLDFDVDSRWSAALVKENGRWLVASLHASANLFDNALLAQARRMMPYVGAGALAVGLALGFFVGRRRRP